MTSARGNHQFPQSQGEEPVSMTFYEAVGGEETFIRLVRRFYEGVADDPGLRPMYPEEDLGPAEERLRLFLIQYWGGPRTYSEQRGHPRLRMRHVPFRIGATERDLWLKHMRAAVDSLELPEALDRQLWEYMVMAAHSMVNVQEETSGPGVVNQPPVVTTSTREHGAGDHGGKGDAGDHGDEDDDGETITISLK